LTHSASLLSVTAASIDFQNPVILAAGTAAYGRELAGVMNVDAVGGIVTKAVSPEPRKGAPAPRVAEFEGGMMNAVGLANPGLDAVIPVYAISSAVIAWEPSQSLAVPPYMLLVGLVETGAFFLLSVAAFRSRDLALTVD